MQDSKKLFLETCQAIRVGFLQQSAINDIDTSVPVKKQYQLMNTIILLYERALKLVNKGIPMSRIKELGYFEEYKKLKYHVGNGQLEQFEQINRKYKEGLKKLEAEYQEHI